MDKENQNILFNNKNSDEPFFTENTTKYYNFIFQNWREVIHLYLQKKHKIEMEHISYLLNISSAFEDTYIIKELISKLRNNQTIRSHKCLEYHYKNFFSQIYVIKNALTSYLGYLKNSYKKDGIPNIIQIIIIDKVEPFFKQYKEWRHDVIHPKQKRTYIPEINEMSMYSLILNNSKEIELNSKGQEEMTLLREGYYELFLDSKKKYLKTVNDTQSNIVSLFDP